MKRHTRKQSTNVCRYCKATFNAKRSDAKFCCDNHRKEYARLEERFVNLRIVASQTAFKIGEFSIDSPMPEIALRELRELNTYVRTLTAEVIEEIRKGQLRLWENEDAESTEPGAVSGA